MSGPDSQPAMPVPRWLTVILGVAGTVIAVAGLRAAADLVAPVFLALMLVIAVSDPGREWARTLASTPPSASKAGHRRGHAPVGTDTGGDVPAAGEDAESVEARPAGADPPSAAR